MQFSLFASVRAAAELPYIAKGRKVIAAHALREEEAGIRVTGQESWAWKRAGHNGLGKQHKSGKGRAEKERKVWVMERI